MARPKSPCGTYAAYRRHLREKSPVCDACRGAQRADSAKRSGSAAARVRKQAEASVQRAVAEVAPAPLTEEGHVSRLEVLKELLEQSRELVALLKASSPERAYLAMREQREIVREISEIQGNGQQKGVSLNDQLAAARAEREERARASGA